MPDGVSPWLPCGAARAHTDDHFLAQSKQKYPLSVKLSNLVWNARYSMVITTVSVMCGRRLQGELGIGVVLYFEVLKKLAWVFLMCVFFALPVGLGQINAHKRIVLMIDAGNRAYHHG